MTRLKFEKTGNKKKGFYLKFEYFLFLDIDYFYLELRHCFENFYHVYISQQDHHHRLRQNNYNKDELLQLVIINQLEVY